MADLTWGPKDPDAIRDYGNNWAEEVPEGATVSSSSWTLMLNGSVVAWGSPGAPEKVAQSITVGGLRTVIRIGAGGTAGQSYKVREHVVFSDGQADDWTQTLKLKER